VARADLFQSSWGIDINKGEFLSQSYKQLLILRPPRLDFFSSHRKKPSTNGKGIAPDSFSGATPYYNEFHRSQARPLATAKKALRGTQRVAQ